MDPKTIENVAYSLRLPTPVASDLCYEIRDKYPDRDALLQSGLDKTYGIKPVYLSTTWNMVHGPASQKKTEGVSTSSTKTSDEVSWNTEDPFASGPTPEPVEEIFIPGAMSASSIPDERVDPAADVYSADQLAPTATGKLEIWLPGLSVTQYDAMLDELLSVKFRKGTADEMDVHLVSSKLGLSKARCHMLMRDLRSGAR